MVAELTIIVALFATGLRIDDLFDRVQWVLIGRLLVVVILLTILAVAGLTVTSAVLLGAVIAPTDPVLVGDVQVGPPLEGAGHPVRFTLMAEAALDDGLAFLFVYLGLPIEAVGQITVCQIVVRHALLPASFRCVSGLGTTIRTGFRSPRP